VWIAQEQVAGRRVQWDELSTDTNLKGTSMKRFFITCTDTDCGKTYVTCQLLQHLPRAAAIKPIASGCTVTNYGLVSSDAQQLHAHQALTLEQINPWRFELAASPHIAAEQAGERVSIKDLADYCMNIQVPNKDRLLIEGAGGLMVPINESETWLDFLIAIKCPVVLVVGIKLGCINHAVLTELALKTHQIQCLGWVANCIDPNMIALEAVIQTLKNGLECPLIARVPYLEDLENINLELM
jgi:dethiobiotin synthetase